MKAFARFAIALVLTGSASMLGACGSSSSSNGGSAGESRGGASGSDSATGGRPGSATKGTFDSIWRRTKGEVAVVPVGTGPFPQEIHVDLPAKFEHPEYGTNVEIFERIQGQNLIVYAHFDGAEVYQRLRFPVVAAGSTFTWMSTNGASGVYDIRDGLLRLTMTQQTKTALVYSTTHYEAYTGSFPPADWPTQVVDIERSDRAGAP